MASNKIVCSTLILSLLAVAAIVALSITVAVYNKKILDFMDRHESEWYNMSSTESTTKFWELGNGSDLVNGTLIIEQLNSTSVPINSSFYTDDRMPPKHDQSDGESHNLADQNSRTHSSEKPMASSSLGVSEDISANEIPVAKNRTKRVDNEAAN